MQRLEIHEGLRLFAAVPQQSGGVIQRRHQHTALLKELPVLLGDPEVGLYQLHGRDAAQTHDDLRVHQDHLPAQIAYAGILLCVQRIPVLGRAALDNVGDIYRLPLKPDHLQHIVQQLPGSAHKGQTLLILAGAGPFPDEQHLGVNGPHAEHHIFPCVRQRAGTALQAFALQFFPRRHRNSSRFFSSSGHNPTPPVKH